MAAAPYKATLSVITSSGQAKSIVMAGSDVNGAAWTFPDSSTQNTISSEPCRIVDISYSAAGTDTSQVDVYVNSVFTNYTLQNSANLYSGIQRQVQIVNIPLKQGATIKFIQKT